MKRQRGFTLIELMVVVVIIGILASMGIPAFQRYVLDGNLNKAKPYLAQIAAKERMYYIRNGYYYSDTTYTEDNLQTYLGVSLAEAGDFCFIVVCRDTSKCKNASGTAAGSSLSFIAPSDTGDPTVEFEVWAALRSGTGNVGVSGTATTCTVASSKHAPGGWVSTTTTNAGSTGRVVVLRYPPPPDGIDGSDGNYHAIAFDWIQGISASDAMLP